MLQSGGVLVKSTTVWSGTPATWGTWPSSLDLGGRWASYGEIYKAQLWVRICVDKRAIYVARLPHKVYQRVEAGREEVRDHPYARLLRRPNERHSRFYFWLWTASTYDIYGEAFWGKVRDAGGRPIHLVPLHPTCMRISDEDRQGALTWDFQNSKVRIEKIPAADLVHFKSYNPGDMNRGLSKLETLRATLENEDAARRATSGFWKNGGRPGVLLTHPKGMSQPAADRLKLQWNEVTGGPDNTGRTVVLEEGMKPERWALTHEEAQYIETRTINREETVAAFDMPPPAVHILDHATFSNIVEQMRSVYRDSMAPVLGFFEEDMEMQLRGAVRPGASEPDFGEDVYSEFLLDEILRGDFEQRADATQKAINSGQLTPNEARRLENRAPLPGGDQLFINSTMVPIDKEGSDARQLSIVESIQKIYLGVGVVITAEEAREILNQGGANLTGPAPTPPAKPTLTAESVRTLMGRLSRQKSIDDIDGAALVAGLGDESLTVLVALEAAKAATEDISTFRSRLQSMAAKE